jgi:type IV secretory pathway VirB4 component
MVISGISGSGKSVLAQKLAHDGIQKGRNVVVLDRGESFRFLALYHDANIFSEKFNPLQFRDPEYLQEFILSFVPESEITHKCRGRIYKRIKEVLEADEYQGFREFIVQVEAAPLKCSMG